MIEPTETESKETLDAFAEALFRITEEPADLLHEAPHSTPISRPDEVLAAARKAGDVDAEGRNVEMSIAQVSGSFCTLRIASRRLTGSARRLARAFFPISLPIPCTSA